MRDWRQQTFLGSFLQKGTKTLAVFHGASRVKRIYFRMRETIACYNAGENEKRVQKSRNNTDDVERKQKLQAQGGEQGGAPAC